MTAARGAEILQVSDLRKDYPARRQAGLGRHVAPVRALDGVTFSVRRGETLGIVGESGCGKSTLARCVTRLLRPTSGRVVFDGQDLTDLAFARMQPIRRNLMMVFQDPYASLNPRMRVGQIVAEPLRLHRAVPPGQVGTRVAEMFELVGLAPGDARRYPHEFSGGQRQRVGIARALVVRPQVVVCDEPVSALDVSVQAQILNLLRDLQRELDLTCVFIAHDLAVVRHIADRVMVMYQGRVAEIAAAADLYAAPRHPYTATLLAAVPVPDPDRRRPRDLAPERDLDPDAVAGAGCLFHPRCERAVAGRCDTTAPAPLPLDGRLVACFHPIDAPPAGHDPDRGP